MYCYLSALHYMIQTHFEPANTKLVIYQLFVRLFGNKNKLNKYYGAIEENGCGKFDDITSVALNELRNLGVSHVWFTGVIEHSSVTSYPKNGIPGDHPSIVKGRAGSPYAIRDYYDVDADLANNVDDRLAEFSNLIKRTHKARLKAIVDFVPNHVARSYHSDKKPLGVKDLGEEDNKDLFFLPDNNFLYLNNRHFVVPQDYIPLNGEVLDQHLNPYREFPAKVTGNDVYTEAPSANDWFETIKLNFGVDPNPPHQCYFDPIPNTWLKLLDILLYWCEKGVDGFRCDMAEMVPAEFWEWIIPCVKTQYPDVIFIAEIYKPEIYINYLERGNFDFLYDKVGLYDTLLGLIKQTSNADDLSRCVNSIEKYSNKMLSFIENHDEERIANISAGGDSFLAIPSMIICATISQGPVMIYNGQEVGEAANENVGFAGSRSRTSIFDYASMPQHLKWMNDGKFDGALLNDEENLLRSFYKQLLNFSMKSIAITKGEIYDLQYLNRHHQSEGYDERFIYSYLRYCNEERLLIVVNFNQTESYNLSVKIPVDALSLMDLEEKTELTFVSVFDKKLKVNISSSKLNQPNNRFSGLPLLLPPKAGLILRIS